MVAGLPLTVGAGTFAAAMFYLALNLPGDNNVRSVLSVFVFAVGHFFLAAAMFFAGEVMRTTPTLKYLGGTFNTLLYVNIITAVIFLFTFMIVYFKQAVLTASGQEEFEVGT